MRPCSSALSTYLSASANLDVVQVDLYTFALTSGEVLRWSGGDAALTIPAAGFPVGSFNLGAQQSFTLGPRFGRSRITTRIGVQAAELDIEIMAGMTDLVGTFPLAEAVRLGIFDGATVELDRLFAPPQSAGSGALDTSLGTILWFYGRVADCDVGRSKIAVKVKSLMNLLALQQMPRRLYGAACTHVFGDAMCGYDRAAGKNALTGATGANTGYSRSIANLGNGSQIGLFKAFLFTIAIGDTFTLLPGCDHSTGTCNATYQNLLRFGGFPYIPPPELAV